MSSKRMDFSFRMAGLLRKLSAEKTGCPVHEGPAVENVAGNDQAEAFWLLEVS